ncbi:MAG TPA: pyridoxal phosphate-dependent aminotransferase [Candidatus Kapabacteria bacterium]|nr:pyridoxal phosphate-dependent aminotransferase [Candidatus Kapabacteria bacterium]
MSVSEMTVIDFERLAARMTGVEDSPTLRIAARATELRSLGRQIVSLSTGEPNFTTPENIKQAGIRAINENFTKYTPAEGIPELRELVAEKFRRDNNINTSAERVIITSGGKHALSNALFVLCETGDEVIIPSPFWASYEAIARLSEATPVIVKTNEKNDWLLGPEQLEASITERSRLLLLNTPVNPTSSVYSKEDLAALVPVIKEHGLMVMVDELYEKLLYDGRKHYSLGAFDEIAAQVITVNGLSKAYAMTGWRLGFATGPNWVIDAMIRLQSQAVSHPSSISQKAAVEALGGPQDSVEMMRQAFERRRDLAVKLLSEIPGISFTKPKGAFYIFFDISNYIGCKTANGSVISGAFDLCEYLLETQGLALVSGDAFGDPKHVRLSFAASDDDITAGVKLLRQGLALLS